MDKKTILSSDIEDIIVGLLSGEHSGRSILEQEKTGQSRFVRSELLPRSLGGYSKETPEAYYTALGIEVLGEADDLFYNVKLPIGWTKRPTDHSMWSNLLDEKGRIRASIFYKAAFYDRSAHISLETRYSAKAGAIDNHEYYNSEQGLASAGYAMDGKTVIQKFIQQPLERSGSTNEAAREQAREWLDEHFPDHRNPLAYWDNE